MVSVIIPCFNQGRYLPEALESVIRQTWADWECIVVNDGSTDDTREVALRFTRRDPRIRYLEKRNGGLSDARNHGLDAARGDLIQFLDADDALLPRKLEAQIEAMRPAEGPVIATCDYFRGAPEDVLREVNGPRHSPRFLTDQHLDELILRWETEFSIPAHCFLFSGSLFHDTGIRFDTALPNHEDWDCWMRLFALGPRVVHVDERLAAYRMHEGSMCLNLRRMRDGYLRALDKHIRIHAREPRLRGLLERKRRERKATYNARIAAAHPVWRRVRAATQFLRRIAGRVRRTLFRLPQT